MVDNTMSSWKRGN